MSIKYLIKILKHACISLAYIGVSCLTFLDLFLFSKVLMCALKSTTLTCLLDDPTMSTAFSEFLLQIQSGLPQGSLRTGLSVPSGSILMSTNSIESERYYCMYTVSSLETILMNV